MVGREPVGQQVGHRTGVAGEGQVALVIAALEAVNRAYGRPGRGYRLGAVWRPACAGNGALGSRGSLPEVGGDRVDGARAVTRMKSLPPCCRRT